MSRKDDEKEFRLRPRKSRVPKRGGDGAAWSIAFEVIMHHPCRVKRKSRFASGLAKPRTSRGGEKAAWSVAFKRILHYARMSSRVSRSRRSAGKSRGSGRPRSQRCAVRVTYARNRTRGPWRAHGRYLSRESAGREKEPGTAGFDGDGGGFDISQRLGEWQSAGDQRLWKVTVSPEFGERIVPGVHRAHEQGIQS